jgi:hypothetical protein
MQVNSANLPAVGHSISGALDACCSTRPSAEMLFHAYHHALRAALSTCNTCDPMPDITNGYVAGAEAGATAVPSIATFAPTEPARASPTHDATASAGTWNIFAEGSVIPDAVRWHAETPER